MLSYVTQREQGLAFDLGFVDFTDRTVCYHFDQLHVIIQYAVLVVDMISLFDQIIPI